LRIDPAAVDLITGDSECCGTCLFAKRDLYLAVTDDEQLAAA